jgi:hypothetical protein
MYKLLAIFGFSSILLTGCNTAEPVIDTEIEVSKPINNKVLQEAEALMLSYTEAIKIHDLVVEVISEMDTETQEALAEAIDAFSTDIEALKYYTELADREPLLDQDHLAVLEITANIEEAIALFANILEVIL